MKNSKAVTLTLVIIALLGLAVLGGYCLIRIINGAVPDGQMIKYLTALLGVGGVYIYTIVDGLSPQGWYQTLEPNEEF